MIEAKLEVVSVDKIYVANLTSIGLKPKKDWQPTYEWAMEQLHSQDSTLEMADIFIEAEVRGDVASHVVRATKGHPRFVVESHRPDWTGKPRPGPEKTRKLFIKASPYAWIEMCRQRLCNQSAQDTQLFFATLCDKMAASDNVFLSAIGHYSMPDCLYRGHVCHRTRKAWDKCRMMPHWKDAD